MAFPLFPEGYPAAIRSVWVGSSIHPPRLIFIVSVHTLAVKETKQKA